MSSLHSVQPTVDLARSGLRQLLGRIDQLSESRPGTILQTSRLRMRVTVAHVSDAFHAPLGETFDRPITMLRPSCDEAGRATDKLGERCGVGDHVVANDWVIAIAAENGAEGAGPRGGVAVRSARQRRASVIPDSTVRPALRRAPARALGSPGWPSALGKLRRAKLPAAWLGASWGTPHR